MEDSIVQQYEKHEFGRNGITYRVRVATDGQLGDLLDVCAELACGSCKPSVSRDKCEV